MSVESLLKKYRNVQNITDEEFPELLKHIYSHAPNTSSGIWPILISALYGVDNRIIESTIPQLVNILLYRCDDTHNELERFLLEQAVGNFHFAMILRLVLDSEGKRGENLISLVQQKVKEDPVVDNKTPTDDAEIKRVLLEQQITSFESNFYYFLDVLADLGERLFYTPVHMRLSKLKAELKALNGVLPITYYPLCGSEEKCLRIVSIVHNDSKVFDLFFLFLTFFHASFSTKARVPYLIFLECIEEEFDCTSPEKNLLVQNYNSKVKSCGKLGEEKPKNLSYYVPHDDFVFVESSSTIEEDHHQHHLSNVYGESWEEKCKRIRKQSPHGMNSNWVLKSFIVKTNDDLRQEKLTMQIITEFKKIWIDHCKLPVQLRLYDFLITAKTSGLVETIKDAISLDALMKKFKGTLLDFFIAVYGKPSSSSFKNAQKNFIETLAANNVICYLLQIKDRHNGNIMLCRDGSIVHIDFGFLLGIAPGGIQFETAPFKLTREFVEVIGGRKWVDNPIETSTFAYFRRLLHLCFVKACFSSSRIIELIRTSFPLCKSYPCFQNSTKEEVLAGVEGRLLQNIKLTSENLEKASKRMIIQAIKDTRTKYYDQYQYLTQGIYYGD